MEHQWSLAGRSRQPILPSADAGPKRTADYRTAFSTAVEPSHLTPSHLTVTVPHPEPAVNQRLDLIGPIGEEPIGGPTH